MATVQELAANVVELSGKIDELKTRVGADIQALRDTVAAQALDQEALDAVNASIDTLDATVDAIDPAPSNPVPDDGGDTPPDGGNGS